MIERHTQAEAETAAIAEDQGQLDADQAVMDERNPADFVPGEAESLRGRRAALLARELRVRHKLSGLDSDLRAEMGGPLRGLAFNELQQVEKRISAGLHKIGFAVPDNRGNVDQVLLAQLVQRHPAVVAARGRVAQLASRASDREFAQANQNAIARLESRVRQSQERLARV